MTLIEDLNKLVEKLSAKGYEPKVADQKVFRDLSQKAVQEMQNDETTLKTVKKLQEALQKLNGMFQ